MTSRQPVVDARATRGRPPRTTHASIEHAALELFARHGFDTVTVDEITAAVGVGRRTLFRYFPSKNDIVWGNFESVLRRLRRELRAQDRSAPLHAAVGAAVVAANRYEPDELPRLRIRMALITSVPALQAHAALRYADWRAVVAEFVAERTAAAPGDLEPQVIAHVALGVAMSAFLHWSAHEDDDLEQTLASAFALVS